MKSKAIFQKAVNRLSFLKPSENNTGSMVTSTAVTPVDTFREGKFRMLAEGIVSMDFALPPDSFPLPNEIIMALDQGLLEIRQRIVYPVAYKSINNLLTVQIFTVPLITEMGNLLYEQPLIPLPEAPPLETPPTISYLRLKMTQIECSEGQKSGLVVLGKVFDNPLESPFGDLSGLSMALSTGYELLEDGTTRFIMLGGTVAGNHIAWSSEAYGYLQVR